MKKLRIAVGTDMKAAVPNHVVAELEKRGFEVKKFGAFESTVEPWPLVAEEVAAQVASGEFDQAVLFCWTGTGISMAANKVKGARAALCFDAETARGARKWNAANILCMSLRLTSEFIADEILNAWFEASPSTDASDVSCLRNLEEIEQKHLK